jgi:hypothetical protein
MYVEESSRFASRIAILAFVGGWVGVPLFYFLRSMTLVHISSSPFFASLSGKLAMASAARSTCSWAKARVCSMPSLSMTSVRA